MGTNMFDVGLNWQLLSNLSQAQQQPAGSAGLDRDEQGDSDGFGDTRSRGGARPTRSNKSQSQSGNPADYAVRHQAAEQRRRARINERLDALRKLVPHDTRSNTASFLEEVIRYILTLKDSVEKLEQVLVDAQSQASGGASLQQHVGSKRRAEAHPEMPQAQQLALLAQAQAAQMQQMQAQGGPSGQGQQPSPQQQQQQQGATGLQGLAETAGALQLQAQQLQAAQVQQLQAQQLRQLQASGGLPGMADAAFLAQAQLLQDMAASQAGAAALLQRCGTPSSLMPPPTNLPLSNGRVSPGGAARGGGSASAKDGQDTHAGQQQQAPPPQQQQQQGPVQKAEQVNTQMLLLQQQALLQQLLAQQQMPAQQPNAQALLLQQFAHDLQAQQVQRLLAGASGLGPNDGNLMLAGLPGLAGLTANALPQNMGDMTNGGPK